MCSLSLVNMALLVTLVGADIPDSSEANVERARNLFDVGSAAYTDGRYIVAAKAFEAAYALAPRPALLFSVGQSYRLQWDIEQIPVYLERALSAYRSYLERDPKGRRRTDAAEHIDFLERQRERLEQSPIPEFETEGRTELVVSASVPNAQVSIDDGDMEQLPLATEVSPGEHIIKVTAPGYFLFETRLVAVAGRVTPLMVRPEPLPSLLTINGPDGAEVYVDGQLAGRAPLAGAVEVTTNESTVFIRKRGHKPEVRRVSLERGEERSIEIKLKPTGQRRVANGMLIGAVASAAITAGLAVGVAGTQAGAERIFDRRNRRALTQRERTEYESLRTLRNDLWLGMGFGAGLTLLLGGAGAVLYFTDSGDATRGLDLSFNDGGPSLTWKVSF